MAYGAATLTGTYKTFDDQPAEGVVEIIPNSRSLIDAEGDVILAGRVKVTLDAAGSFTVTLPATDDATVEPATGRQYTVVAKLRHTHLAAITGIELATGSTVDVADVSAQPEVDAEVTNAATTAQLAALESDTITSRKSGAELLRHKLATGQDATWVHVGDSTGDATTEWLYLALTEFAADYPHITVAHRLWNDTTQGYDAATTVQTGTGTGTLTVYNGSMPGGSLAGYFATDSTTRAGVMVPVAPDLLTISTSHNDAGGSLADYLLRLDWFIDATDTAHPGTPVAVVSQNPEFAPRTSGVIAGHLERTQALRERAIEKGWGYVAAAEKFLRRSDGGAALVDTDGVHPLGEGVAVWRDAALAYLRGSDADSFRLSDTGWRLVASGTISHLNGFKCAARRIGSTVHVVTEQVGTGATGTGAVTVATLPVGFRATSPAGMYPLVSGSVVGSDTLHIDGASIYTDETGAVVVNAVTGERHYCTMSYATTDPWPTDLPGTAA